MSRKLNRRLLKPIVASIVFLLLIGSVAVYLEWTRVNRSYSDFKKAEQAVDLPLALAILIELSAKKRDANVSMPLARRFWRLANITTSPIAVQRESLTPESDLVLLNGLCSVVENAMQTSQPMATRQLSHIVDFCIKNRLMREQAHIILAEASYYLDSDNSHRLIHPIAGFDSSIVAEAPAYLLVVSHYSRREYDKIIQLRKQKIPVVTTSPLKQTDQALLYWEIFATEKLYGTTTSVDLARAYLSSGVFAEMNFINDLRNHIKVNENR